MIERIRRKILKELYVYYDTIRIIDSLPIPICHYKRSSRCRIIASEGHYLKDEYYGVCGSKGEKVFGFKLHMLVTLEGIPTDFTFAPASYHDVNLVWDLVDDKYNLLLMGDKGYISKGLKNELKDLRNITLITPTKKNQREKNSKGTNFILSRISKDSGDSQSLN